MGLGKTASVAADKVKTKLEALGVTGVVIKKSGNGIMVSGTSGGQKWSTTCSAKGSSINTGGISRGIKGISQSQLDGQ